MNFQCAFLCVAGVTTNLAAANEVPLYEDSVVVFANVREGISALTAQDDFIKSLGPFDRQVRLATDKPVSQQELLAHISGEVLAWPSEDVEKITGLIESIRAKLSPLKLQLPEKILLVLTTGKEEANAAYCRAKNAVVLPRRLANLADRRLQGLLIHELFHILSRNNPELRRSLYAIIGFKPCPDIELPEWLRSRSVTNPDAVAHDYYIDLTVDGKVVKATPVISIEGYDPAKGESFFPFLKFRLMVVQDDNGTWNAPQSDGHPVLLDPKNVPSYEEQIGKNTKYIIHPEEIMADNFTHLVNKTKALPTPRIVQEMRALLAK